MEFGEIIMYPKLRKTEFMYNLLNKGKRLVYKRKLSVVNNYFVTLFEHKSKSGWRYVIDYTHDHREHNNPFVIVRAFSPEKPWKASYFLRDFD